MDGKKRQLISLLVISNVSLFGVGLYLGLSSSSIVEGSIRVFKMDSEIVPGGFEIFGPNLIEINGTFETGDGVIGNFPSENISWNSDVFNITISPSEFSTYFSFEINVTTGEGFWYYYGWLIIVRK